MVTCYRTGPVKLLRGWIWPIPSNASIKEFWLCDEHKNRFRNNIVTYIIVPWEVIGKGANGLGKEQFLFKSRAWKETWKYEHISYDSNEGMLGNGSLAIKTEKFKLFNHGAILCQDCSSPELLNDSSFVIWHTWCLLSKKKIYILEQFLALQPRNWNMFCRVL